MFIPKAMQGATFQHEVKVILAGKQLAADSPAINELTGAFASEQRRISLKVSLYKLAGFVLLFSIPVISAVMTFALGKHEQAYGVEALGGLGAALPWLSLALTLLTVLNSIIKPAMRFDRCCHTGLDLFHWRCTFLEGLEKMSSPDDKHVLDFVTEQRKLLRKIQEAQINLALPYHS